jgi:hypothetical protein
LWTTTISAIDLESTAARCERKRHQELEIADFVACGGGDENTKEVHCAAQSNRQAMRMSAKPDSLKIHAEDVRGAFLASRSR